MAEDIAMATLKSPFYVLLSNMSDKSAHIRKRGRIAITVDVPDHYDGRLAFCE